MRKLRAKSLAGIMLLIGVLGFLGLTFSTMYRQNHAVTILEYHNIAEGSVGKDDPWTISLADFEKQIEYLSKEQRVVPLRTLLEDIRQGKPVAKNTVAITFDDGYRSNYWLAYPVLKRYHMPATIFVVGKFIEQGHIDVYPIVTWPDLKEMTASGLIDIQSHSYDLHYLARDGKSGKLLPAALARLDKGGAVESKDDRNKRVLADLRRSKGELEARLGNRVDMLSWPFGAYDQDTVVMAKRAGLRYLVGKVGYTSTTSSMDSIQRIAVTGDMTMQDFIDKVNLPRVNFFQAMGLQLQRIKVHLINFRKYLHG